MSITLYQGQLQKSEPKGDPQALDVQTRWPLVTINHAPVLAPCVSKPVGLRFPVLGREPRVHFVADIESRIIGFICEYWAGGELPVTYWPVLLDQEAWPFVSTRAVQPEFIPTSVPEAFDLLQRSMGNSYVALDPEAAGDKEGAYTFLLGSVAWLEAWNTVTIEVLSLLNFEGRVWTFDERTRPLRTGCESYGISLPPGLPG